MMLRKKIFKYLMFLFVMCLYFSFFGPARAYDPIKDGSKVLLICLDGATWNLIDPFIHEGLLPNFARLKKEGASGILYSKAAFSPPCWTSIATGKNEEKHGVHNFSQAKERRVPYIWDILDESGVRPAVVNWLMTTRQEGNIPMYIRGWYQKERDAFFPIDVENRLKRDLVLLELPDFWKSEAYHYWDVLDKNIALVADNFVKTYQPSFLAVGFTGTNPFQHRYWSAYEPQYFDISASEVREKKNVIKDYYRKIDAFLSDFIRKGYTIVFVSDHGFCRNDTRSGPRLVKYANLASDMQHINFLINHMLEITGYLVFSPKPENGGQIDLSKTRAYFYNQPRNNEWGIKLNRKIMSPERFKELQEEILHLLGQVSFETGKKVFEGVRPNPAASISQSADILFRMSRIFKKENLSYQTGYEGPGHIIFRGLSDGGRQVKNIILNDKAYPVTEFIDYSRDGVHEHEGVVLMWGRHIKRGALIESSSLVDITPTILYLFGLPIAEDMDGKVLTDALEADFVKDHPVEFLKSYDFLFKKTVFAGQEQQVDKERLHSLGYAQ